MIDDSPKRNTLSDAEYVLRQQAIEERARQRISPELQAALPDKFPGFLVAMLMLSDVPREWVLGWLDDFGLENMEWYIMFQTVGLHNVQSDWSNLSPGGSELALRLAAEQFDDCYSEALKYPEKHQPLVFLLLLGSIIDEEIKWWITIHDDLTLAFLGSHVSRDSGWIDAYIASGGNLDASIYADLHKSR
jgi:hypothetical protein